MRGTKEVDWAENGNDNNVGGVIMMWRRNCFLPSKISYGYNYSIIEGEWRIWEVLHITIVIMYNSSSLTEKIVVWEEVRERRRAQKYKDLVCG